MKKLFVLIGLLTLAVFPIASHADRDDWGEQYEHHHGRPYSREIITYYPRPWVQPRPYREVIQYYPQPPRYRYYTPPYPRSYPQYYPVPPSYQYQSYQVPSPAPGLGAAAGSYLGNRIGH
jgi:hypothetical protein